MRSMHCLAFYRTLIAFLQVLARKKNILKLRTLADSIEYRNTLPVSDIN
jgi:hypothetical protein